MLAALLSTFEGTELWNSTASVIPLSEKVIGSLVKSMQAENGEHTSKILWKLWSAMPENQNYNAE